MMVIGGQNFHGKIGQKLKETSVKLSSNFYSPSHPLPTHECLLYFTMAASTFSFLPLILFFFLVSFNIQAVAFSFLECATSVSALS